MLCWKFCTDTPYLCPYDGATLTFSAGSLTCPPAYLTCSRNTPIISFDSTGDVPQSCKYSMIIMKLTAIYTHIHARTHTHAHTYTYSYMYITSHRVWWFLCHLFKACQSSTLFDLQQFTDTTWCIPRCVYCWQLWRGYFLWHIGKLCG